MNDDALAAARRRLLSGEPLTESDISLLRREANALAPAPNPKAIKRRRGEAARKFYAGESMTVAEISAFVAEAEEDAEASPWSANIASALAREDLSAEQLRQIAEEALAVICLLEGLVLDERHKARRAAWRRAYSPRMTGLEEEARRLAGEAAIPEHRIVGEILNTFRERLALSESQIRRRIKKR